MGLSRERTGQTVKKTAPFYLFKIKKMFFKELWNDKSVSASILKILMALWAVGALVLSIKNILTILK